MTLSRILILALLAALLGGCWSGPWKPAVYNGKVILCRSTDKGVTSRPPGMEWECIDADLPREKP